MNDTLNAMDNIEVSFKNTKLELKNDPSSIEGTEMMEKKDVEIQSFTTRFYIVGVFSIVASMQVSDRCKRGLSSLIDR